MNKQEAQKALDALQQSIKEATEKAKELQEFLSSPDVVFFDQRLVVSPFKATNTFYVTSTGGINSTITRDPTLTSENGQRLALGKLFETVEAAERYVEYLKVRQKARIAMALAWGNDKPTWAPGSADKYCILYNCSSDRCKVETFNYTYQPIHFPTRETADAFISSLTNKEAELLCKGM